MSNATNSPLYARAPGIIEAEVGSVIVLLHTGNWQYFELDKIGGAIWTMLAIPMGLEAMVSNLTAQFEVSPEQCASETTAFLTEAMANGLFVFQDG